jgi:hypothetical protein
MGVEHNEGTLQLEQLVLNVTPAACLPESRDHRNPVMDPHQEAHVGPDHIFRAIHERFKKGSTHTKLRTLCP